ncbi:MAG: response regulator, partial [Magnetococcales bacterium]|nr:response regulator [Magnetococcales bacterium]
LGIGRDITERREMEATIASHQRDLERLVETRTRQVLDLNAGLEEMASRAVAANKAKSAFLANMSHEIRTPMNAILGLSHLLELSRLEVDQRELVRKIQGAGQALLAIINDVLDFSKIEAGHMELHCVEFDLDGLLDELAVLMAGTVGQKDVELVLIQEPGLPSLLKGDGMRLSQVLINLVGNAIKFTESGHVLLRVGVRERLRDRLVIRFSVQDTGIGIHPELLGQMFRAFTQVDPSNTRSHGGSGLGLAISKRLVELMGGELGASSVPEVGSEFWAEVPLEEVPGASRGAGSASADALEVVIAVGHARQQEAMESHVRLLGWRVGGVVTGENLLAEASRWRSAEVWLVDRRLPRLDEIIRRLNAWRDSADDRPIPLLLIILNAGDQNAWCHSSHVGLVDGVLAKPVTPMALFRGVVMARVRRQHPVGEAPVAAWSEWSGPRLSGMRLLLVDDCTLNLEIARRILELEGATVTTAQHGLHALELLKESPDGFDVVLMDVQMPVMDGNEAVRHIRRQPEWAGLPVVALTAGALDSDRHRAMEAGMTDVIAKPFDVNRMIQTVLRLAKPGQSIGPPRVVFRESGVSDALWPEIPGIDTRGAMQRLGGEWSMLLSMLRGLLREFRGVAEEVGAALRAGERERASMRLHQLRGLAGNVGAVDLQRTSGELETALRSGAAPEALEGRCLALEQAMERLTQAVEPWLNRSDRLVQSVPGGVEGAASVGDPQAIPRLVQALNQHDFQAIELFGSLIPMLNASLEPAAMQRLALAIERFDFEVASDILAAMPRRDPAAV